MSFERDKFRNPPIPLGYVRKKPELVLKKTSNSDDLDIERLINLVIESGICDEPDASLYDHFTINTSSEEDEVIEVPVVSYPKKIEIVDVEDDAAPETKKDILVAKEVHSSNLPTTSHASEDLEQGLKASASEKISVKTEKISIKTEKISIETEPCSDESKTISLDDKPKKHDQGSKKSSNGQKVEKKSDTIDSYYHGSSSHSKSNRKHKKKDCASSDDFRRKSQSEKRDGFDSDSDSHSRSRNKKRRSFDSDSDSHGRSRQKKNESYDTDSDSYSRRRHSKRDYSSSKRKVKKHSSSDDSNCSSEEGDRKQRTTSDYTSTERSCEEKRGLISNIKEEYLSASLHGEYLCEVCKITVNSLSTFQSHINGKRHLKTLNAQKAAETTSKESIPVETVNKYPKPPPGYYRLKMDITAKIQPVIDQTLKTPCPGLDHVTEILGFGETTYYCFLCSAQCVPSSIISHLKGFKHLLNLLKEFEPDLYQKWSYAHRSRVEPQIMDILKNVEKIKGRGLVKVEKDFRETDKPNFELEMASWRDKNQPSTSAQATARDLSDNYISYSVPDPSKSGYYCRLCDSHSNSEAMWQSHIVGKRHLANVKKAPGTAPSKNKYVLAASDVRAYLFDTLREENPYHEPVVGLSQIREIRKPEINGVSYTCYLCCACVSKLDIVNHILSKKHREKYLDSVKDPEFETVKSLLVSESQKESIIADICGRVEEELGSGVPEVCYTKNSVL